MKRKRITELFPFLVPLRIWQRNVVVNLKMSLDKNKYAKKKGSELPYEIASNKTWMINEQSGHDIIYQQNKVHNLKITSQTMNKVYIEPGEIFSFNYLEKYTKKYGKLKDGLTLRNDKIIHEKGGGVCHLSNLLYYTFLKTPLTIVERHGHKIKSFPNPDKDSLDGVDATINKGWQDLKVRNDTEHTYQIIIDFDEEYMYAKILADYETEQEATISNEDFKYIKKNDKIYESVAVVKTLRNKKTKKIVEKKKLYDEIVAVGYELPEGTKIEEVEE